MRKYFLVFPFTVKSVSEKGKKNTENKTKKTTKIGLKINMARKQMEKKIIDGKMM